jgi:hypothetical protein
VTLRDVSPVSDEKRISSQNKTSQTRFEYGTNRSNRFLPRETVQHQDSVRLDGWEWHGCAIRPLSVQIHAVGSTDEDARPDAKMPALLANRGPFSFTT